MMLFLLLFVLIYKPRMLGIEEKLPRDPLLSSKAQLRFDWPGLRLQLEFRDS